MTHDVTARPKFITNLFLIVFAFGLFGMSQLLLTVLTPVVLSLVLVSLFLPVYDRICAKVGSRRIASFLTSTLVVLCVGVPIGLLVTTLTAEAVQFYQASGTGDWIPEITKFLDGDNAWKLDFRTRLETFGVSLAPKKIASYVAQAVSAGGLFLYDGAGRIAANMFAVLLNIGLIIIMMGSLFVHGRALKAYILDLSPLPDDEEELIFDRFRNIARNVFVGNGVASGLQGVLGGLGFIFFGLGSGVLWGAAIAFFAFLPIVGASVVVLPAAGLLMIQGRMGAAIGFLVYNAVVIGIFEYGVKTKLVGGQMNGVLIFLGIVAGLTLFGMLGIFYGPLIITMFLTLAEIYKEHYREGLLQGPLASAAAAAAQTSPLPSATEPMAMTTTTHDQTEPTSESDHV